MDSLLNRYRSTVLLLALLVGQFILLAYQVKNDSDVRIIRVWAITVITPIAQIAETTRSTVYGVFHNYFDLRNARDENQRMRAELNKLKLENQFYKAQVSTADRVKALSVFAQQSPSKLLAARIIGAATTSSSKIVFLDRGSNSEVEKGMAVITPDGIVGKVLASYPTASQALLATDPEFAAGVISQTNHVRGILRGAGSGKCRVDNVQNEEKVDPGEQFFTSGDDRVFPRGLPVGKADVVRDGPRFKDILVYPSGLQNGPEEVLIVLQGSHQLIPDYKEPPHDTKVYMGDAPPADKGAAPGGVVTLSTDADRLREKYQKIGAMEGHKFGEGSAPNFNVPLPATDQPATPPPGPAKPVSKPTRAAPAIGDTPIPLDAQRVVRPAPLKPRAVPAAPASAEPDVPATPER